MLKHWWLDYWWVLALLAYCILLVILIRSGTWAKMGQKIVLAVMCVFILLIPAMRPPGSYIDAVIIVLNLLLLFRAVFKPAMSSRPSDE